MQGFFHGIHPLERGQSERVNVRETGAYGVGF
jgi:hypothetical protein